MELKTRIKEIILCSKNKQDVDEIAADYLKGLTIHYVEKMADVLKLALLAQKVSSPKQIVAPEKNNVKTV